jgi:hypothetical protein
VRAWQRPADARSLACKKRASCGIPWLTRHGSISKLIRSGGVSGAVGWWSPDRTGPLLTLLDVNSPYDASG